MARGDHTMVHLMTTMSDRVISMVLGFDCMVQTQSEWLAVFQQLPLLLTTSRPNILDGDFNCIIDVSGRSIKADSKLDAKSRLLTETPSCMTSSATLQTETWKLIVKLLTSENLEELKRDCKDSSTVKALFESPALWWEVTKEDIKRFFIRKDVQKDGSGEVDMECSKWLDRTTSPDPRGETYSDKYFDHVAIRQWSARIAFEALSLISLLSLPVNVLAIGILTRGKCGLSTCTTRYLVVMAAADLLVLITDVILLNINVYFFQIFFLYITPVCSLRAVLRRASTDCSVWFTVTFTFDRFVTICCQKLRTNYCTKKTATIILATTCFLLCSKNIPFYFVYQPGIIIHNVPLFCTTKLSYYTEPSWVGFNWFNTVLTPLLPFALILLLNGLTVRHILVASRVRKGLKGQNNGENPSDPEMESRRKSMILLFTISGSFILLWLLTVIEFLYYTIPGADPLFYNDSEYVFQQVGVLLRNSSCCTNTFIYGVTQSKFREQIKNVLKYPFTSIIQLINKKYN
ncbi:putative G-protein coupled receptor 139 [Mustelus asterias]